MFFRIRKTYIQFKYRTLKDSELKIKTEIEKQNKKIKNTKKQSEDDVINSWNWN